MGTRAKTSFAPTRHQPRGAQSRKGKRRPNGRANTRFALRPAVPPDAPEGMQAADEYLPAGDGRGRVALVAQVVLAHRLVLRGGLEHERLAGVAGEVQVA